MQTMRQRLQRGHDMLWLSSCCCACRSRVVTFCNQGHDTSAHSLSRGATNAICFTLETTTETLKVMLPTCKNDGGLELGSREFRNPRKNDGENAQNEDQQRENDRGPHCLFARVPSPSICCCLLCTWTGWCLCAVLKGHLKQ